MIDTRMNTANLYKLRTTQIQPVMSRVSTGDAYSSIGDSGGLRAKTEIKSVAQPEEKPASQTQDTATGNSLNTQNISQNRQEFAESLQSNLNSIQSRSMQLSQSNNQSNALKALNTNTNLPDADAYFRKDPVVYQQIQDDILKNDPDYVSNQLNRFPKINIDINLKAINSDMQLLKKYMG